MLYDILQTQGYNLNALMFFLGGVSVTLVSSYWVNGCSLDYCGLVSLLYIICYILFII